MSRLARFRVADRLPPGLLRLVLPGVVAGALAHPGSAAAQEWRVDVLGGRDHVEQGPVAVGSSTLLVGVRASGAERWAGLFAGVPVESEQTAWGALAGSARLFAGAAPVRLGMQLAGQAFAQRARDADEGPGDGLLPGLGQAGRGNPLVREVPKAGGWGAGGEALAVLRWERGPVGAEARAGATHYHSDFADQPFSRTLPQMHLQTSWAPDRRTLLQLESRRFWSAESGLARIDLTVLGVAGPATLWGSVGRWVEGPSRGAPWAAGVRLSLERRLELVASTRHEPFEPLYGTPDRTTWSVGLSARLGAPRTPPPPVPHRYRDGVATVALPVSAVPESRTTPRIAGDFNAWTPEPMRREGDRWTFDVAADPGVYNYAFVSDDGEWFVPESVPGRKDDGFGGHVAVLVVQER